MTEVKMLYEGNLICGFEMEGHAGYNPTGPDVICASLSAASQLTVNGILDATGIEYEDLVKELNLKTGVLKVSLNYDNMHNLVMSPITNQLFKAFELYVSMLSEQYPDYVKIERREDT